MNHISRSRAVLRTWLIPFCCLFFALPLFPETGVAVDISADTITRGAGGEITAQGSVVIKKEDETLAADRVVYGADKKTINADGNVKITSKKSIIKAESGKMDTSSKNGELHHAEATLKDGERLKADLFVRDENNVITVENATFTSCPACDQAWLLKAGYAELDQEEGVFTARDVSFELAGIPVLYTPYWRHGFRRKSGFLMPHVATSSTRGTEMALPYYLAPAENWDATLTPYWMTARGFKGDIELRHVSTVSREKIQAEGINDKVASRYRGRLRGDIHYSLPYDMSFDADADHVTDHNYIADYATNTDTISSSYLQSQAALSQSMEAGNWSFLVRHQQNLSLDSNATTLQVLPRFESSFHMPVLQDRVLFHFDQQSTLFSRKLGEDGWRVDLNPYLEVPWQLSGGGIEAVLKAGGRHTRYWLKETSGQPRLSRNTFELSLDTRLNLESISESRHWRHTLSPVLRYDYIAAPDQSNLPNFDSTFGKLLMSNLLSGNRFTGRDRVERLNRVSLLLETGLQHKEKSDLAARDFVSAKAGIAYDLKRETVDPAVLQAPIRPFSNLLGEISIYPVSGISISASGQYDPGDRYWASTYTSLNMKDERGDSLNISWQHTDGRYAPASELINSNAEVSINQRWKVFGSWQFDPRLSLTQQASSGVHYLHKCWDLRVEGYRNNLNGSNATSDFGFRFLLGFKGLGSVGS